MTVNREEALNATADLLKATIPLLREGNQEDLEPILGALNAAMIGIEYFVKHPEVGE